MIKTYTKKKKKLLELIKSKKAPYIVFILDYTLFLEKNILEIYFCSLK